jgi:hypothetical protein
MKRERKHVSVLLFAVALSYLAMFAVPARNVPAWLGVLFPLVGFVAGGILAAIGPLLTDRLFGLAGALPGCAIFLLWLKSILLGD